MNRKTKDNLNKYLWVSAIIHIVFMFVFSGVIKFSDDEFIVPASIQVDLVAPPEALPQKNQAAPEPVKPEPQPEPKPVEEPKPDKVLPKKEPEVKKEPEGPKVNLEQEKKKKKLAKEKKLKEEKLKKELAKKKKLKKEKQRKKDQDQAMNKLKQKAALDKLMKESDQPAENKPITGARLNPGTSFSGMDAIQFSQYYDTLKVHLFNNWSLPQWLSELDLKAQALVVIDGNGYVIRKEIIKSSGNPNFDNTILGAIEKASPFPVAPDRLKSKVQNKEIVFGFPEN